MSNLKPWEPGYIPMAPTAMTKVEAGAMGGKKAATRRKAGLPPIPAPDKVAKQGRKRTNPVTTERAERATAENISLKKKMFLDKFVFEYLHDFNSSMAWIRAGGPPSHATTGGPESLRTAYVQNEIRTLTERLEEDQMVTRGEVVMGIKREAHYHGEDGSSASRVRAWGLLAKLKGMEAPVKVEAEVIHRGGVMLVPVAGTIQDWESAAAASQLQLKNDVRK